MEEAGVSAFAWKEPGDTNTKMASFGLGDGGLTPLGFTTELW